MDNNRINFQSEKKKAAKSAATVNLPGKVQTIIGDIKYLNAESLAILKQRGQEWYDRLSREGPAMCNDEYSKVEVCPSHVAGLGKVEMHLAKEILIAAANVLGIDVKDGVTIKQFCHLFNLKEETVCTAIRKISEENALMAEIFNTPEARAQAAKSKKKALASITKLKPTEEPYAEINGLKYLTAETIDILTQRVMAWFDKWPIGEPMYSGNPDYKLIITTNQVACLCQISIRTAQDLLKDYRDCLGREESKFVTVKEFCFLSELDEDDCRRALQDIAQDFSVN